MSLSLASLLTPEIAALRDLEQALVAARRDLAGSDPDAVLATASHLQGQLARVAALAERRNDWLQRNGHAGMEALLSRTPEPDRQAAQACWQEIVSLTRRCEQASGVGGAIVDQQLRQTRRALDLLAGRSPDAATYGRHGETRHDPSSHRLTMA